MSSYYTGITLNQVPTGFGTYTGFVINNDGNLPIDYTISISPTVFTPAVSTNSSTIFITDDPNNFDPEQSTIKKTINPSANEKIYILHKPYTVSTTGIEKASLSISSISSIGDSDDNITIDITGQRLTGVASVSGLGSFYSVKNVDIDSNVVLDFYWKSINPVNYFTGYKIQIATDTGFSSIVSQSTQMINQNVNLDLPLYGSYSGFVDQVFNYKIGNLTLNQDYYARLQVLDGTGGTGYFFYPTGFENYNVSLTTGAISGEIPAPGSNLKTNTTGLYINYSSDLETDFDLYSNIISYNDSTNFMKYTGINIKFSPKAKDYAQFVASDITSGALNFIYDEDNKIYFNTGLGGVFRLEMEFENIRLYGKGGNGSTYNADGTFNNPQNGGPVFNLSKININDVNNNMKTISYYLYKDSDSVFNAGVGGGPGLLINSTTDDQASIPVSGTTLNYLNSFNLTN